MILRRNLTTNLWKRKIGIKNFDSKFQIFPNFFYESRLMMHLEPLFSSTNSKFTLNSPIFHNNYNSFHTFLRSKTILHLNFYQKNNQCTKLREHFPKKTLSNITFFAVNHFRFKVLKIFHA